MSPATRRLRNHVGRGGRSAYLECLHTRGVPLPGIARKILLYLLERARTAGTYEAFLEVRPSNTTAARLYHSMGFEQVGIRRGYYQATAGREDGAQR